VRDIVCLLFFATSDSSIILRGAKALHLRWKGNVRFIQPFQFWYRFCYASSSLRATSSGGQNFLRINGKLLAPHPSIFYGFGLIFVFFSTGRNSLKEKIRNRETGESDYWGIVFPVEKDRPVSPISSKTGKKRWNCSKNTLTETS
jgi:hypothetical protein